MATRVGFESGGAVHHLVQGHHQDDQVQLGVKGEQNTRGHVDSDSGTSDTSSVDMIRQKLHSPSQSQIQDQGNSR